MRSRSVLILGGLGDIARSMSDVISSRLPETRVHLADARQAPVADTAISILPPAEDDSYPAALRALVERFDPDVIIPTNEAEIHRLASSDIDPLIASRTLLESREHIVLFGDKLLTYEWGIQNGIPTVPTRVASLASEVGFPLIIKPRNGSGGKGQTLVRNASVLEHIMPQLDETFVVQPYIDAAKEFTCVTARVDSEFRTLVLERTLRVDRSDWICVANDEAVIEAAHRAAELLQPQHSLNFQFLKDGSSLGLIDVNPRFSSTVAMRDTLGFNDLVWVIKQAFGWSLGSFEAPGPGTVVEWTDDEGRELLLRTANGNSRRVVFPR